MESCCAAVWLLLMSVTLPGASPVCLHSQETVQRLHTFSLLENKKIQRKCSFSSKFSTTKKETKQIIYILDQILTAVPAKLEVCHRKGVSLFLKDISDPVHLQPTSTSDPVLFPPCLVSHKVRADHRFEDQRIKGNIDIFSHQRPTELGSRQHARLKYYVKTRVRCITMAYYY